MTTSALALLFALASPDARAQYTEWTGAVNSDWLESGNWSGGVPNAGSDAAITFTPQAVLTGTGAAGSLLVVSMDPMNPGSLAIDGGRLDVTSNADVTGGLVIRNGGQLSVNAGTGTVTTFGNIVVESGSVLAAGDLQVHSLATTEFRGGTVRLGTAGGGIFRFAGSSGPSSVTLAGSGLTLETNVTSTIDVAITGTGALTKTGTGRLQLSGTNTYSGGTFIQGGSLVVSLDTNLGDRMGNPSSSLTMDDGTLEVLDLTGNSVFFTERSVILQAGGGTLENGVATSAALNGNISGVGALTKTGSGEALLQGTNTYSGGTVVNAGLLQIPFAESLATNTPITVNGGVLDLNFSFTTSRLSGTGGGLSTEAGTTLTVNQSADTTFAGVISGSGSVRKTGSGTLILSGSNTYSHTTISEGTLAITGTTATTGNYNVVGQATSAAAGDATLAGTGSIGLVMDANVSISSTIGGHQGILYPGLDSADTMELSIGTLGNNNTLTLGFESLFRVDIGAAGLSDSVQLNGNLVIDPGVTLELFALPGAFDGSSYTLLSYSGTLTGTFANVSGLPPSYYLDYGTGTNSAITVIPEPSSSVLVALALGALYAVKRRRSGLCGQGH